MKVGDLVRDQGDGDLGIITSTPHSRGQLGDEFIEVRWVTHPKPMPVALSAVEKEWVVVISG